MSSARPRPSVRLRRASVDDLALLVRHRHRMWSDIGNRSEADVREHDQRYRRWARLRLRSGELAGVVAETPDGFPVGSGLVWFRPDQPRPGVRALLSPYILSMYTEPEWRGRGVASQIVGRLVAMSRRPGIASVVLHASKFGRRLYRRLGFERTWEMRFWLDPRIPKRRALAEARSRARDRKGRTRKGLDRPG